MAISGNGFFAVQESTGTNSDGSTAFSAQQYYTRAGDFSVNKSGYLVNSAGEYLQGWSVDPNTGVADQTKLQTIKISDSEYNPVPTSKLTLSANLPATPSTTATTASQVQIYDALGTKHTLNVNWTQNSTNDWTATITSPDNTSGATIGTAEVKFGAASGNPVDEGTIGSITGATGAVTSSAYSATGEATLTAIANFGVGDQPISIDLGAFGSSSGVTQFAGTAYTLHSVDQNGAAVGAYSGVTIDSNGSVIANYDNGLTRTLAEVPIATFTDPDALNRVSGQAFTANDTSGLATNQSVNANQAGSLVVGSSEASNVDIATEFSKLIVAQQAYGANSKVITTADDMLTQTIDMKR